MHTPAGQPRRKRVTAALIMLLALTGIMLASATPASAESSSAWTTQYPWPHNGCTRVTDYPMPSVSFTYACNHHDGCYAYHWADRGTCDAWFRNDMYGACWNAYRWNGLLYNSCIVIATGYWTGVRILGQQFYDSNGTLTRISTPMNVG
ncbi:phospholipase A2 [Pedococcus sp. 5OH_020]|uniref:phospholipase A2 n=1 Tax=Pedococcus sp. 5OH_020 TaxID=2989814 RepID=UPI0022E998A9|nr:phospholipase A2 [Pedococcus sp. 5OH_020]